MVDNATPDDRETLRRPLRREVTTFRAVGCMLVTVLLILVPCGLFIWPIVWDCEKSARRIERLLHATDHQAVLAGCRELMAKYPGQTLDAGDTRLPKVIQELDPIFVEVTQERVLIALHGSFDHFGVVAYPKGIEGDGAKKLIDGLWYFDEGHGA